MKFAKTLSKPNATIAPTLIASASLTKRLNSLFERNALETLLAVSLIPDDAGLLYADVRHILVTTKKTRLPPSQR